MNFPGITSNKPSMPAPGADNGSKSIFDNITDATKSAARSMTALLAAPTKAMQDMPHAFGIGQAPSAMAERKPGAMTPTIGIRG